MTDLVCPRCAQETETLHEGYCQTCRDQGQRELDDHNHAFDAALIAEAPTMSALLEAIDKSWTAYWPEGPDVKHENVNVAEETAVIWRGIRESLSRIRRGK